MSTPYIPPVAHWEARQWHIEEIAVEHRSRPFLLLWKRCAKCRRRWPCPPRRWADAESLRLLP